MTVPDRLSKMADDNSTDTVQDSHACQGSKHFFDPCAYARDRIQRYRSRTICSVPEYRQEQQQYQKDVQRITDQEYVLIHDLRLKPDKASASYNALGEDVKKKLGKEIKKVNKALKKKANRVYFSIDRLDFGEFAYDASKSGAGKKVFVRKDGSGDTLTLGVKTKIKIDPMTWIEHPSIKTVLDATLSGYRFRIPKGEYKKTSGSKTIIGKMRNLAGSTV